jgi:CBS domain-containing protein
MKARDVMTRQVVSVSPDTTTRAVARLLVENKISAVPVVDTFGAPVGMVSEGDLVGRDETDREARRDWWLTLFAEGEMLHPDFLASLRFPDRPAKEVMSSPVISVGEDTDTGEIARLQTSRRIKRVPVVRDGRVVGIVSRANLVRMLAEESHRPILEGGGSGRTEAIVCGDRPASRTE